MKDLRYPVLNDLLSSKKRIPYFESEYNNSYCDFQNILSIQL
ncbi:hypothetical protein HMPREF9104_01962 [Lentilactobacillus kisonensis F0435]|uniref:Uncharacterized protein n=1 Tax=Lentilactobacillus kisonensis F0435 TaxID=797516 RepID=H1LH72_9LACO|nr:hypothetical protein HMPREF9104_01962 [Lentilactobacillus kisonensis F0435]